MNLSGGEPSDTHDNISGVPLTPYIVVEFVVITGAAVNIGK